VFGRGRRRRWFDDRLGWAKHDGGVHRCPVIDGRVDYDTDDIEFSIDDCDSIDLATEYGCDQRESEADRRAARRLLRRRCR
jgi:hypothetical protein